MDVSDLASREMGRQAGVLVEPEAAPTGIVIYSDTVESNMSAILRRELFPVFYLLFIRNIE